MKYFFVLLFGIYIGVAFVSVSFAYPKVHYPYSELEAGTMIDSNHQFMTYETICSGYYIIDTSNKKKTVVIGYGDLKDKYTYEIQIPDIVASSSSSI